MDPDKILQFRQLMESEFHDESITNALDSIIEISDTSFTQNPSEKLYEHLERSHKNLETKREMYLEEQLSELREKPLINKKSKAFTKNSIPIFQRVDKILNKRKENLKILQEEALQKKILEEEEVCTFKPNLINRFHTTNSKQRSDIWLRKIQEKKNRLMIEKEEEERRLCTERPWISEYSKKLAEKRSSTPIHRQPLIENLTFKPKINSVSEKYTTNREKNVFERLYTPKKLIVKEVQYTSKIQ